AGLTIAVRADRKPDEVWPWQAVRDAWVLRPIVAPNPALLGADVYEPFAAWKPGLSADARKMIFLIGVLIALLVLAAAMVPRRWSVLAVAIVAIASAMGIEFWRRSHPPIARLSGAIRVIDNGLALTDAWTVFTSLSDARGSMEWRELTFPVVADESNASHI